MWAAHDDVWEPEVVAVLAAFLGREPGCVLVFPRCDEIDESGRVLGSLDALPDLARWRLPAARMKKYLLLAGKKGKATVIYGLMRTSAARATGGMRFCSGAGVSWDNLLVFGLLAHGWFGTVDRTLFHKRRLVVRTREITRLTQNRRASILVRRHHRGYRRIIRGAACLTGGGKAWLCCLAGLVEAKEQWKVWRI